MLLFLYLQLLITGTEYLLLNMSLHLLRWLFKTYLGFIDWLNCQQFYHLRYIRCDIASVLADIILATK